MMTAVDPRDVRETAARAALAVPGVAELQPSLGQSLADAAVRVGQALGSGARTSQAGVRADHTADTGGWHVEVRCVLREDCRTVDAARDVHDHVRAAVLSHVTGRGAPGPVTVAVTVTRITGPGSRDGWTP
jgi:hypothetical protein